MSAEEHDTDPWPSDPDYLRDVADRIFSIPVMYGLDDGDSEHLREIADQLAKLERKREECSIEGEDGVAARVDRLRAIGNGQVPRVAATAFALLRERGGW